SPVFRIPGRSRGQTCCFRCSVVRRSSRTFHAEMKGNRGIKSTRAPEQETGPCRMQLRAHSPLRVAPAAESAECVAELDGATAEALAQPVHGPLRRGALAGNRIGQIGRVGKMFVGKIGDADADEPVSG